jgi:hypothetical protein
MYSKYLHKVTKNSIILSNRIHQFKITRRITGDKNFLGMTVWYTYSYFISTSSKLRWISFLRMSFVLNGPLFEDRTLWNNLCLPHTLHGSAREVQEIIWYSWQMTGDSACHVDKGQQGSATPCKWLIFLSLSCSVFLLRRKNGNGRFY